MRPMTISIPRSFHIPTSGRGSHDERSGTSEKRKKRRLPEPLRAGHTPPEQGEHSSPRTSVPVDVIGFSQFSRKFVRAVWEYFLALSWTNGTSSGSALLPFRVSSPRHFQPARQFRGTPASFCPELVVPNLRH